MPDQIAEGGIPQIINAGLQAGQPTGNLSQVQSILSGLNQKVEEAPQLPPEVIAMLPPEVLAALGITPPQAIAAQGTQQLAAGL